MYDSVSDADADADADGYEWQTKALGCLLRDYRVGDRIPGPTANYQFLILGKGEYRVATVYLGILVHIDSLRNESLPPRT